MSSALLINTPISLSNKLYVAQNYLLEWLQTTQLVGFLCSKLSYTKLYIIYFLDFGINRT